MNSGWAEELDMIDKQDSNESGHSKNRRLLLAATASVAGVGVVFTAVPFVASLSPSQRAQSAAAPVEVDVSRLEPGQQLTVVWRGRPVWILRRTPYMLERLQEKAHLERLLDPDSEYRKQQPEYARNPVRAMRPEYLVLIGICTHLGCVPHFRPETAPRDLGPAWIGGYFCPCHGSRFDLAGRVYRGVPAPLNLVVPPYRFLQKFLIQVGVDPDTEQV
mgnify:CR=1 FL=1